MVPPWIAVGCRSELLAWTDLLHPDDPPQVSVVVPVCSLATPSSPANSASSSRGLPRGSVMSRLGLPVAPHGRPAGGRLHRCDHRPAAEKDLKSRTHGDLRRRGGSRGRWRGRAPPRRSTNEV